ncbi:MAG: hypothetical protein KC503_20535 [Myxococcales bacterium]|nr:hypothetical protein [Myxococcales bacterium]
MRALALALLPLCVLAAASGCRPFHLQRNAPGRVDVRTPPRAIKKRGVEVPDDPGENWFTLSGGGFVGGGGRWGGGRGGRGVYGVGLELTAQIGRRKRSHNADDFLLFFPFEAIGLNVGWTLAEPEGGGIGAGYVELQVFYLLGGLAAGYAFDPGDGVHGPQFTAYFGPIYVRVVHLFDRGTDLQAGLFVKWPLSWVWSR